MTTNNQEPLGGVFTRLLQAAKVYAFNYLQDEAEDEEVCIHPKQHAEAKELFAAIKEAEKVAIQQAGAAGASEVKTWQERLPLCPTNDERWACIEAENADLRAQLARQRHGDKPVAYMVSSEDEPELGFWFSEEPGGAGQLSQPLYTTPAAAQAEQGELVAWEYRFFDQTNEPHQWREWKRVEPRNFCTETVADRVAEIREYIKQGYKYELRALYTPAVQLRADDVLDAAAFRLMAQHRLVPSFRPYFKVGIVGHPDIEEFDAKSDAAALRRAIERAVLRTTSAAPADKEGK